MIFNEIELKNIQREVIDYRGKTPKKLGSDWADNGYRALSAKNIKTGKIVQPETIRYVDEDLYKKWMKQEVEKNTILITSEAPFGEILFWDSDEKIVLSQRLFAIKIKKDYFPKYIYYYMISDMFQNEMKGRATGTTVTGLRQPELLKCIIKVPDYDSQVKIAKILSSLDAKMEINNKISDNLHELLKNIYEDWFVNYNYPNTKEKLHSNWLTDRLGEYLNIERGLSYKGKFLSDDGVPMINLGNVMPDGVFRLEKNKYYSGEYKEKVTAKAGDIVIANTDMTQDRAVIGSPVIIPNVYNSDIIYSHHIYGVKNLKLPRMFVFYTLLRKEFRAIAGGSATGTTVLALPKDVIENYEIEIPDKFTLEAFSNVAETIYKKREILMLQNIKLEQLRDTLLPKLMNGEIDLDSIEV